MAFQLGDKIQSEWSCCCIVLCFPFRTNPFNSDVKNRDTEQRDGVSVTYSKSITQSEEKRR